MLEFILTLPAPTENELLHCLLLLPLGVAFVYSVWPVKKKGGKL